MVVLLIISRPLSNPALVVGKVEERHGHGNGAASGSAEKGLYPAEEMDGSHKVLERVLVRLRRFQVQIWEQTHLFLKQGH